MSKDNSGDDDGNVMRDRSFRKNSSYNSENEAGPLREGVSLGSGSFALFQSAQLKMSISQVPDGLRQVEGDCTKVDICYNGIMFHNRNCGDGKAFDEEFQNCTVAAYETTESTAATPAATSESTAATPAATSESTAATPAATTESTAATPEATTESTAATPAATSESTAATPAATSTAATPAATSESTAATPAATTESTAATPESTAVPTAATSESTAATSAATSESTAVPATATSECCNFPGREPNLYNCSKYFECISGAKVEKSCGQDQLFDGDQKQCYPTVFATCKRKACKFSGRRANSDDCKKYSECINNVEVELSCGPGELFDNNQKDCYPAVFAECIRGSITTTTALPTTTTTALPTTTTTSLPPTTATPCTGTDREPNKGDCKKYFECINNVKVELSCGPGELFDYKQKGCYPAVFAECIRGSITTTTALPTTTLPFCDYNGRHPNPDDCKKYFECINNVEVELSCGPDEKFDYNQKNCYPTVFAKCIPSSTPKPCNFLGRRADTNDCKKYSECVNNAEVELSCGPDELFDDGSKTCYPAVFVTCKQGAVNPYTAKLCNFVGRKPDANDCQSYKECVNGKVVVQRCGTGEVFDTANLMCLPPPFGQCNVVSKSRKRRNTKDVCSKVKVASKVPYPGDPRKYYYCSKTRKQAVFQCDDGYIFSEKDGGCFPNS
ncbi:chitin-binding domain protein cbd-1-like [Octopus bimaculoides]|uniref:chitin-binding domain protein cbd-1-like n=1 Tax=Octopus bimaculoides TaxID=37653 RepID=UPI0022E29AFE|nr:chitin-binding domain protein cbd-1-like [Octopus bimaculoides]